MTVKKREEEAKLWKNFLDKKAVESIASSVKKYYPSFDSKKFVTATTGGDFFELELKQRIERIADSLKAALPDDYRESISVLSQAAPHLKDFTNWALMTIVEKYGLDDFDDSIKAMESMTQYSSAEFAIRPYMIRYTDKMLPLLKRWTKSDNFHIRRLAAEAARPRGVWVKHVDAFIKKPELIIPILENLKADESLYVRKAVANCLNDITKDHPEIVIDLCETWLSEKKPHTHTKWIIRHGLRSLIKAGHPRVFPLLGFEKNPKVAISKLQWDNKKITIGSDATLSFVLSSEKKSSQKLSIDYAVHYVKKNGKTSPKVFKLTEKTLKPNEPLALSSKHSFKEMTTRKHYPGKHQLDIIVNGVVVTSMSFTLK